MGGMFVNMDFRSHSGSDQSSAWIQNPSLSRVWESGCNLERHCIYTFAGRGCRCRPCGLTKFNYFQDVISSMRADQSTNASILSDIEDRIAKKMVEIQESDEINESEFHTWLANIDQELDNINCDMYKLTVNTDRDLLAEGFSMLGDLLKPRLTEFKGEEENIFGVKVSKELNDHYDRQDCYAHLLTEKTELDKNFILKYQLIST